MSRGVDLFNVPNFLVAPSKERLVRLMLLNNIKKSKEFNYFDIQKDGAKWVAWYYDTLDHVQKNQVVVDSVAKEIV